MTWPVHTMPACGVTKSSSPFVFEPNPVADPVADPILNSGTNIEPEPEHSYSPNAEPDSVAEPVPGNVTNVEPDPEPNSISNPIAVLDQEKAR